MLGFVDWLTTRTNNGVVRWEVKPNLISTKLLGPLLAEFVIVPVAASVAWTEFTIRDDEGKEVFRACPQDVAGKESGHAQVAERLFEAVMERVRRA